jgi:hypothetical protein
MRQFLRKKNVFVRRYEINEIFGSVYSVSKLAPIFRILILFFFYHLNCNFQYPVCSVD